MLASSGDILVALADPTRRSLFERLSQEGELTVHLLTDHSGVSQPAVSKHLRILKQSGLVRARHEGRETHYSVRPHGLAPLVEWMSFYSSFWQARFHQLEDLLKRMDQ